MKTSHDDVWVSDCVVQCRRKRYRQEPQEQQAYLRLCSKCPAQERRDALQGQVKCLVPACGAYIDVPLAVLLRARGVHLLGCVGTSACWEQHARGRPSSRVINPRPAPPASLRLICPFIHACIHSCSQSSNQSFIHPSNSYLHPS